MNKQYVLLGLFLFFCRVSFLAAIFCSAIGGLADAQDTVFRYSGSTLVQSGTTLAGPTGLGTVNSGDQIVVEADISSGGTVASSSNLSFTIGSDDSSVYRTINGGADPSILTSGSPIVSDTGTLTIVANQIRFEAGSSYSSLSVGNSNSWGGALFADGGTLTLSGNAEFSGNRAVSIAPSNEYAYASGGAVASESQSVSISGTHSFYNNSIYSTGLLAGSYGGAVTGSNAVTITGSGTYSGNQATAASTGSPDSAGLAFGGAIASYTSLVSLTGTFIFENNSATGQGTNGFAAGGAIGSLINGIALSGDFTFANNQTSEMEGTSAYGGALSAAGSITLSGEQSSMSFTGNTANGQPNDIYTNGTAGSVTITNGGTYYFGGGISSSSITIGETAPTNGNPTVTFGANSSSVLQSGVEPTFMDTLAFWGFLTDPTPTASTNTLTISHANLIFEIGNNFALRDENNPYIDATQAVTIAVSGANTVSFDESTLSATTAQTAIVDLIQGSATNSDPLGDLPQGILAQTLLATYQTEYDAVNNRYILTLTTRDSNLAAAEIGGNAPGLVDSLGAAEVLGNQTSEADVIANLSALSGETIASAASVMVFKLNYINQTMASRATGRLADNGRFGSCPGSRFNSAACACATIVDADFENASNGPENGNCRSVQYRNLARRGWVSGFGLGGNSQVRNRIAGYDFQSGGFLTGIDWTGNSKGRKRQCARIDQTAGLAAPFGLSVPSQSWAPEYLLSGWFGYGQTGIHSRRTNLSSKDYSFGGLACAPLENVLDFGFPNGSYGLVQGGFQFNNFEGTHAGLTETTDADFNAWESTVYAELGLSAPLGSGLVRIPPKLFNPFFGIQYISYRGGGLEIENLSLGQTELDSLQTILGSRFRCSFTPAAACADNWLSNWNPVATSVSATLAWRRELSDANGRFTATGTNGTGWIYGNSSGRDWAELSLEIATELTDQISVGGNYYLFVNGNSCLNAGMGTLILNY